MDGATCTGNLLENMPTTSVRERAGRGRGSIDPGERDRFWEEGVHSVVSVRHSGQAGVTGPLSLTGGNLSCGSHASFGAHKSDTRLPARVPGLWHPGPGEGSRGAKHRAGKGEI